MINLLTNDVTVNVFKLKRVIYGSNHLNNHVNKKRIKTFKNKKKQKAVPTILQRAASGL